MMTSLITLLIQFHSMPAGTQPSVATVSWATAVSMLLGLLLVPLYRFLLMLFRVMFGVMYCPWRDVCGDDAAPDMAQAIAA